MRKLFAAVLMSLMPLALHGQISHPILPLGSPAPNFALPGVDGKIHKLSDYASSPVLVVVFTCDHCPIAQMYERRIEQLYENYGKRGVAVVAIEGNDPQATTIDELDSSDLGDTLQDMKIRVAYNYNSLQAQVNKRLANGIAFGSAYTWSKFLDDMDVSPFNGAEGNRNFQNFHDPHSNYGPSNFDIRESLKSSIVYQLPFGLGRTWLNKNRLLDTAIGGWQVSAIVINQTGNPYQITYDGANNSYSQAGAWYPNQVGSPLVSHKSIDQWYNPNAYVGAANGTFGDVHRNSLFGPGIDTTNLSMGKTFHLFEGAGLQFRADASNVFNHPGFSSPDGNFNDAVDNTNPLRPSGAGTINSTTVGGRNMQISARLTF